MALVAEHAERGRDIPLKTSMSAFSGGTRIWKAKGNLHREDGPAVEYASGSKEWWLDGKMVRVEHPRARR